MEKGGHEKITSDPRLRLKVDHAALRSGKDKLFDPERFKTDYQVEMDKATALFFVDFSYSYTYSLKIYGRLKVKIGFLIPIN